MNFTFLIPLIIIMAASLCLWYFYRQHVLKNSINTIKHVYKTPHLTYAHYSNLPTFNKILFPELWLTKEQDFTLNSGDALLIPKGWWHWVETVEPTFAVNFWINEQIASEPIFYTNYLKNTTHVVDEIKNINLLFWDEKNKISFNDTANNLINKKGNMDDVYMISLDAFHAGRYNRKKLLPLLSKHICKPHPKAEDPNFWLSLGYYDTGVHFDDKDGILIVLNGKKKVRLFPPKDSWLLHPINTFPKWSNYKTKNKIFVNKFKKHLANSPHTSQSKELYLFLYDVCKSKSVFTIVDNLFEKFGKENIVWGIKKTLGGSGGSGGEHSEYRLEFYVYCFKNTTKTHNEIKDEKSISSSLRNTVNICKYANKSSDLFFPDINKIQKNNLMIHSFNVYLTFPCVDSEIHLYYKTSQYSRKECLALGQYVNEKNNINFEGLMFGSAWESFDLLRAFEKTKFKSGKKMYDNLINLLKKYPCDYVFLWNKKEYVLIQFCSINTKLYLDFLKEYNYPKIIYEFIEKNNEYNHENISHEVGFSLDKKTNEINRTAIYGIL